MKWPLIGRLDARWVSGLAGAAFCMLVPLIVWSSQPLGPWLTGLSFDLALLLRGDIVVSGAAIVAMDEQSHNKLDQNPSREWNRTLHADLLDRAFELGARAVVFDVWFADPAPNVEHDRRFLEALQTSGRKVVLAAKLQENLEGGTNQLVVRTELLPPTAALAAAAPWGIVDLPPDGDGRVRRHWSRANYPALAWRAAEAAGLAPEDPTLPRWINFYGPIPRKSYREVLQGTNVLPAGFFSNQVVFVGRFPVVMPSGPNREDLISTPLSRWSSAGTPGVEVQATLFLNLLHQDWLNEMPRWLQTGMYVGCGLLLGGGLVRLRPGLAIWVALGVALLTTAGAVWLFSHRIWFPWLLVSGVQVPCAFVWSVVAHTQWLTREKQDLERRLATSMQADRTARPPRKPLVPDHTLIRCVGQGAYGEVWLARDLVGNFRAVKAVYRDRFPRAEPFDREFRGIQNFSPISRTHPGWVDVLHIGRLGAEEGFFYIMEAGDDESTRAAIDPERYAPRTLASDLQRRGKLPVPECVDLGLALADALVHLHQHGLIHRDIKPSNVIFVHGAPKFADIGLVTNISTTAHDVSFLGTEGYIAPEGPGTPIADVFSLGKLIYEICSGRDRRAFPELPTALEAGESDPALEELYRIVLNACEPEARHRYASAAALRADLARLRETLPSQRRGAVE